MRVNKDKNNFRSPLSNVYFPDGNKTYVSQKVHNIEEQLNTFLKYFQECYYQNGTANGFVTEILNDELIFNIGCYKSGLEVAEDIKINYQYKHCCEIKMKTINIENDISFPFDSESQLHYFIQYNFNNNEKTVFKGILNHKYLKQYRKSQKKITEEEIIENIGPIFEKNDSFLRTLLQKKAFTFMSN